MATPDGGRTGAFRKQDYEALARFRHALRRFVRFSENAARRHGITPQQHQLLLSIKGFPGRDWATVGELAERLQLRHHSVVGEIDRAEAAGLVVRTAHPESRRAVGVRTTALGERILASLTGVHQRELESIRSEFAVLGELLR